MIFYTRLSSFNSVPASSLQRKHRLQILPTIETISTFRVINMVSKVIPEASTRIEIAHELVEYAMDGIVKPVYRCTDKIKEEFALVAATDCKLITIANDRCLLICQSLYLNKQQSNPIIQFTS